MNESWYSDAALEKRRALDEWTGPVPAPAEMYWGIFEPRVPPTPEERCVCCGLDARSEDDGQDGRRYCGICLGRGHDEP